LWVYTTIVDREKLRGSYDPYTKERWERIKKGWNLYKSAMGLEGDLYIQLENQGLFEGEVSRRIEEHRETRKSLIEDYRREIKKDG